MVVSAPGSSGLNSSGTQLKSSDSVNKSDFLRLLTEQLRHQDPLNPMQDRDMMAQLAQFSTLEETTSMRGALDKIASGGQLSNAAGLIGKTVQGLAPAGFDAFGDEQPARLIEGVVSGVILRDNQAILQIGDDELPLSQMQSVSGG